MDFSDNPMAEPDFKFYDKSLLDDVRKGDPNVHEFFRLLALCHTVMPEYKEGKIMGTSRSIDFIRGKSLLELWGTTFLHD